jgi:hypothetical protein
MADEKIFADGFIFKRNENAPDFVVGNVSVKVDEAITFLKAHQSKGWVNLNVKKSQGGKYYTELDTWKPKEKSEETPVEKSTEDLPF